MRTNLLAEDLDHVLDHTRDLWNDFRGERIFITGGTGFFGCWMLESFAWANDRLGLNASALVLTRNLEAFQKKTPHLTVHPAIKFHYGDYSSYIFPAGSFSYIIHAAADSNAKVNAGSLVTQYTSLIQGTQHTLEFAVKCDAQKFLLTSSGAAYGMQPPDMTHIAEDYPGTPDPSDPRFAYGEGKRAAELLSSSYSNQYGFGAKIARCFAFVGPYLPMDAQFAIGNFIRDGLKGGPIVVSGDGTPYRSYLYTADLAIWLWTILVNGKLNRLYNVGSEESLSIAEVARLVANKFRPKMTVEIHATRDLNSPIERYVPNTSRAKEELGLDVWISLSSAISRTKSFERRRKQ